LHLGIADSFKVYAIISEANRLYHHHHHLLLLRRSSIKHKIHRRKNKNQ